MLDFYTLSVLAFAAIIAAVFYLDRKNVRRESVLLLRRTQRGKKFIIRIGRAAPGLWKFVGTAGVIVCFAASVWIFYALIVQTQMLASGEIEMGPGLVLPSPSQEVTIGPGVFLVPFWFWIISLAVLVVVHEGMHGIIAASERIRIKSLGWGALAVIPLAFVEPDEKQLEKQGAWKQLRVFAAGSFSNFMTALVMIALSFLAINAVFTPAGVLYQGVINGTPAYQVNLTGVITEINGIPVNNIGDLDRILSRVGPGRSITIDTYNPSSNKSRQFILTTAEHPDNSSKGYIGIGGVLQVPFMKLKPEYVPWEGAISFLVMSPTGAAGLLGWIFLINLFVGLFNLLPIGPLDGGRMWRILLDKLIPKHSGMVMRYASYVTFSIILLDFALVLL